MRSFIFTKVEQLGYNNIKEKIDEIKDAFSILQDDHCTPVSHVMTLKNHIFTIVPKDLVEVDWRLPVFPCGQSLIAFDGAALLINELYLKKKNRG